MKGLIPAIAVVVACACTSTEARVDRILSDAQVELRRGQVSTAQALVERGVKLTETEPDAVAAWRIRLLRAEVAIAGLEMAAALKDLEATPPAGDAFNLIRARQKYLQSQIQLVRGQLKPALEGLAAAVPLAAGDPDLLLDIEVMGSQARLRLGQWDEAETRLNAVLSSASSRGDRFREALAINNLGMSRLIRNRWDEALPQFERVLSYKDLEQTRIYAASLNNTGVCLARLGQFDRAIAFQQRAVQAYERSGRRLELMTAVGELGTTYVMRNELTQALPYLQRALSIATEGGVAAESAVWGRNLATAHVTLGNWDDAARYNDEARRISPPTRPAKLVFNTAIEAQIAAARGDYQGAEKLFRDALAGAATEPGVQWQAQEGLARIAVATGQPSLAAKHFEAALQIVEKTRSALLKTDYRLSFLTRVIRFYQTYVDFLMATGQTDRALEVADSSRGRVLAERLGVAAPSRGTAAAFQRRAKDGRHIFVFYWLDAKRSLAWVVSPGGIRHVSLAGREEIEPLVDQHQTLVHNTLSDPLTATDSAGARLYARVIAPLASSIPPGSSVVIVPDGALHRLNFETLPVRSGGAAHYWIEDVTIQIAPSLAMMTATAPRKDPTRSSLLLVGNPTPRPPEFPALTYAAAEIEGVSKQFGAADVTLLQSEQASPAGFRDAKPERFAAIHFTSHAVANIESPMDSAVILSGRDSAFKLYARDVAEMPLSAELVTVSACRSAGERTYTGEGLVGFAWAFLRAGSQKVVAGLWDVDDRSTAALMERFYEQLVGGGFSPAAALRSAKLEMVKKNVRPYYWGPLQMFTVSP